MRFPCLEAGKHAGHTQRGMYETGDASRYTRHAELLYAFPPSGILTICHQYDEYSSIDGRAQGEKRSSKSPGFHLRGSGLAALY